MRDVFISHQDQAGLAFKGEADGWKLDLYLLARQRLASCGVTAVYGGDRCTLSEPEDFFSYRRDGQTGRMASLIWLEQD